MYIGTFHQYDGIMYPEKSVKGLIMKGWFGATEMSIPSHNLIQQQCLHMYLRHHREILLNCKVADIYLFTMSILPIFHQMLNPKVYSLNCVHIWRADGVTQVRIQMYVSSNFLWHEALMMAGYLYENKG